MYSLGAWEFFIIEQYKRSLLLFMFICFFVWQALLFKITKNIECISRCDLKKKKTESLLGNRKHELKDGLICISYVFMYL